jgi:acyl-CoA synthetase (AMP-forming)/AMP-acid ligase II
MSTSANRGIFDMVERAPDDVALCDRSGQLTWDETSRRINDTAQGLLDIGFRKGRLAVLGSNSSPTVIAYASALVAGVGVILLNYHSPADELRYLLEDGEATALWASSDLLPVGNEAATRLGIPVLSGGPEQWTTQLDLNRTASPAPTLPATTDLIYTSGTTGHPKGVEIPWQPAPTVQDRMEIAARHHMTGLGPHLVSGPLYHAGPHAAVGLLLTGSPVILMGHFDAEEALTAIEAHRVATTVMVPTHLIRLLSLPDDRRRRADVSSLRMVALTGAPCPFPVKKAMIEWFGPVLREAYGGSESGIISYITSEDWLSHPGSVGRVQAPFRAVVLDEGGAPCPPDRNGELYFEDATGRGIRYHNDPEKTGAAHLRPGVFTLGDMGHVDADGYLYITGRVIDMVISGGVNIYPAECERVLSSHPAVKDVAVFGRPDDDLGERLVGLVSMTDDDTTAESLISFCRRSIAAYKVPKQLVVVPEIPRSAMGKVDKGAAAELFAALTQSRVTGE